MARFGVVGGGGGQAVSYSVSVVHGDDANMARPPVGAVPVIWHGTVEPVNADGTRDVFIPVTAVN